MGKGPSLKVLHVVVLGQDAYRAIALAASLSSYYVQRIVTKTARGGREFTNLPLRLADALERRRHRELDLKVGNI